MGFTLRPCESNKKGRISFELFLNSDFIFQGCHAFCHVKPRELLEFQLYGVLILFF